MERIWQLPRTQGKLTEGQPEGWKVDRKSPSLMKSWCKFTVNPADAWKVNWCWQKVLRQQFVYSRSCGCTTVDGSWWKVLRTHGKLTEGSAAIRKVHRRTSGCTESWWKLPKVVWMQRKLTTYPRSHGKLTEGAADAKKAWRKLTETSATAQKVDERSYVRTECQRKVPSAFKSSREFTKVPRPHEKWTEYLANALKLDGGAAD